MGRVATPPSTSAHQRAIAPEDFTDDRTAVDGGRRRIDTNSGQASRASHAAANNIAPHVLAVGRRNAQQAAGLAVALDEAEIDDQEQRHLRA